MTIFSANIFFVSWTHCLAVQHATKRSAGPTLHAGAEGMLLRSLCFSFFFMCFFALFLLFLFFNCSFLFLLCYCSSLERFTHVPSLTFHQVTIYYVYQSNPHLSAISPSHLIHWHHSIAFAWGKNPRVIYVWQGVARAIKRVVRQLSSPDLGHWTNCVLCLS